MTKIKTILIDDEPKAIDILKRYCKDSETIEVLASFRNPVKAVEFLQQETVDLIFLDINMPKLNGLEFLNVLEKKPKVIFTTAYSEYALDSYNYDTIDYLVKPIDFQRFLKSVTKAKAVLRATHSTSSAQMEVAEDKTIYIKSGQQLHKVNINDILYLEKEGNYLTFFTKDRKILSRQNMKDVFEILDPEKFLRVHKSYVVGLQHMEVIETHQIKIGDAKIPVGRNYREELMNFVSDSPSTDQR